MSSEPKKISVITVSLNNAAGLKKTIDSVKVQTVRHIIEHIVIDGASSDDTPQLLRSYNSILDYWVSEKDSGIYNAMNKGILKSSGEYLLFLNSGDYLCSDTVIEHSLPYLNGATFCYSNLRVLSPEGIELSPWVYPETLDAVYMKNGALPHPATFIHRSAFNSYLYSEQYKIASDWEFFYRKIVFENASYCKLPVPVSFFVLNGISSNRDVALREQFQIYDSCTPLLFRQAVRELEDFRKLPYTNLNRRFLRFKKQVMKLLGR
ncbi:MAG: glycosyltransferase [Muribaculaceae bacterium]|nr:glycosyltransferase [Muribaculaceae bacterium]